MAVPDSQHVSDAVAGKASEAELVHGEPRALHRLPVWVRQGRHEPLAIGPSPKSVGSPECDTEAMVPDVRVEAPELDLTQGLAERAKRLPVSGAAARDHPP